MKFRVVRHLATSLSAWLALSVVLSACEGEDATRVGAVEIPLATPIVPTQVENGLVADRTEAGAGVDSTGAATVTIPIWTPEGRNGVQPNLSLQYSSRAGNDVLGLGWSLTGLPQITLCPRTLSQDGRAGRVMYPGPESPSSIRYCLNGERLVATSGTYGRQDAVYDTERSSYAKIVTPQVGSDGPVTFIVYAKDGTIFTLGETALNATVGGVRAGLSAPVKLAWYVSRVEDRYGNFMTVNYTTDQLGNNRRYPLQITYTGNSRSNTPANRSVRFLYEQRPDPLERWVSGLRVKTTDRVREILVGGPSLDTPATNGALRHYLFNYRNDSLSEQSLLASIQECDGPWKCKPPTTFDYSRDSIDFDQYRLNYGAVSSGGYVGDINGDGCDDMLFVDGNGAVAGPYYVLGTPNGDFSAPILSGIPSPTTVQRTAILADLNHDGFAEFVRDRDGNRREMFSFDPRSGTFVRQGQEDAFEDAATANSYRKFAPIFARDINGDSTLEFGFQDLAVTASSTTQRSFFRPPGSAYVAATSSDLVMSGNTIDLLGTGITDVLARHRINTNTGYQLVGQIQDEWVLPINLPLGAPIKNNLGEVTSWFPDGLNMFDANGDGLTDVAYDSAPGRIWINRGTGQFEPQDWATNLSTNSKPWLDFDVDGDGRVDRVGFRTSVYLQSKPGSIRERPFPLAMAQGTGPYKILDINGDGREDILTWNPNTYELFVHRRRGLPGDLLLQVTDGFGKYDKFTYATLRDRSLPAALPPVPADQRRVVRGMTVVATHVEQTTQSFQRSYGYKYADGRFDLRGYGFLGFSKVSKSEDATRTTTTTSYDLTPFQFYARRGRPASEVVSVTTDINGSVQSRSDTERFFAYNFHGYPLRLGSLDASTSVYHRTDGGGGRKALYSLRQQTFDDYGNVTFDQTTTENWLNNLAFAKSSSFATLSYSNDPATWQIGKLLSSSATSNGEDGSRKTLESTFTYDSQGGLSSVTEAPGTAEVLTTRLTRDARGLVTRIDAQDSGPRVRTTNIQYDATDFIYPTLREDLVTVAGVLTPHRTRFSYHPGLGVLTSQTDPNGVVTSWSHDGFGRVRAKQSPLGDHKDIQYRRGTAGPLAVDTTVAGGSTVTTEYDVEGREVLRRSLRYDGGQVTSETAYTALGSVQSATLPHWGTETKQTLVYQRDWLDRPIRRFYSSDETAVQTYRYATSTDVRSQVTEIDELGNASTSTLDGLGRPVQVSKGSITVSHTFGAQGKITKSTRTGSSGGSTKSGITTYEYDLHGRRTAIVDPDTGRHETQYNGFGEVASEATVVGTTKTYVAQYERDDFGRPIWIASPQGGTKIAWDRAGALGKMDWERSPDGITTWYGYTPAGAPSRRVWTDATGKTYAFSSTYDSFGRLARVQYPAATATEPFAVNYKYTAQGNLAGIYDDAATPSRYWEVTSRDSRGLLTGERFADSNARRTYDAVGRLTRILTYTDLGGASPSAQWVDYTYWKNGNLHHRDDTRKETSEAFEYDANGRITKWGLSPWNASPSHGETYSYDALGNLQSVVGDNESRQWEYATGKPHTVARTRVGGTTVNYTYNDRGVQTARTTTPTPSASDRTIQYTAFDLPSSITTPGGTERFQYDAGHSRFRKTYPNGDEIVYAGPYEKRTIAGVTTHVYTLEAQGRTLGQVFWTEGGGAITQKRVSYMHDDLLNSVDALTDGRSGITRRSYRPFGTPLVHPGLSTDLSAKTVTRGFTGHEHDSETGLVNAGGRMYDPELKQFLTPDPVVSNPLDGEAYNRYRYANNSPVNYVDPSGFFPVLTWPPSDGGGGGGGPDYYPGGPNSYPEEHGGGYLPYPQPHRPSAPAGRSAGPPPPVVPVGPADFGAQQLTIAATPISSNSTLKAAGGFLTNVGQYMLGLNDVSDQLSPGGACGGMPLFCQSAAMGLALASAYHDGGLSGVVSSVNPIRAIVEPLREAGEARERGDYRAEARGHARGVFALVSFLSAARGAFATARLAGAGAAAAQTGASSAANGLRLGHQLMAEEIAGGHSFTKHVFQQFEFPGITSRGRFAAEIENFLNSPRTISRPLSNGRTAYWNETRGTVLIRNPAAKDGGTFFRPEDGAEYFWQLK